MPTTPEVDLWRVVDAQLETPATPAEREFIRLQELVDDYLGDVSRGVDCALDDCAETMVKTIHNLRRVGLPAADAGERIEATPSDDRRWQLVAELHAAANPGSPAWPVLTVTTKRPVGFYTGEAPEPMGRTVEIAFDHRLSFRALVFQLRRLWPELLKAGFVRRTRPLDDRTIALLRFVCLESPPGTSWRKRWEAWNQRWRDRPEWRFKDTRALTTAFHRAERQLTGKTDGLAWYYNQAARLSADELRLLADQGDAAAARLRRKRWEQGLASLKAARIGVETKRPPVRGGEKEADNGKEG